MDQFLLSMRLQNVVSTATEHKLTWHGPLPGGYYGYVLRGGDGNTLDSSQVIGLTPSKTE